MTSLIKPLGDILFISKIAGTDHDKITTMKHLIKKEKSSRVKGLTFSITAPMIAKLITDPNAKTLPKTRLIITNGINIAKILFIIVPL